MDNNLTVKKREGGEEPWNYDKLVASINKSGVPLLEAENIAKNVENWARETAEGPIESTLIRDKVIELMKENYPAESDSYLAYKKG